MENLNERLIPDPHYPSPSSAAYVALVSVDEKAHHHQLSLEDVSPDAKQQPQQQQQQQRHHYEITVPQLPPSAVMGEKQANSFRDIFAAILFLGHLSVVFYLAFFWGFPYLNYKQNPADYEATIHLSGVVVLCLTTSLSAFFVSAAALHIMTQYAELLVQSTLCISIGFNVLVALYFLIHGFVLGLVCALVSASMGFFYAVGAWHRIPFAVANLRFALTAVRSNAGVVVVACAITLALQVWTIIWLAAWLGVYARHSTCDYSGDCTSHVSVFTICFFLLSFFWTSAVGKNVLHVTISGVVGTFCFAPDDAGSFWSNSIPDSLLRATTFSFGSICFGSLLSAVLQLLYQACRQAKRYTTRQACLLCVLECATGFLERIVVYFNKWGYTYIGLYGYDYLTACRKVIELFRDRGWSTLVTDGLLHRALIMFSTVVGLGSGVLGFLLNRLCPAWLEPFGSDSPLLAFLCATLIGSAVAYILFLSVIGAAVDTMIVVIAEAPLELEQNHPGLYRQMVAAWGQVYPDEFRS